MNSAIKKNSISELKKIKEGLGDNYNKNHVEQYFGTLLSLCFFPLEHSIEAGNCFIKKDFFTITEEIGSNELILQCFHKEIRSTIFHTILLFDNIEKSKLSIAAETVFLSMERVGMSFAELDSYIKDDDFVSEQYQKNASMRFFISIISAALEAKRISVEVGININHSDNETKREGNKSVMETTSKQNTFVM